MKKTKVVVWVNGSKYWNWIYLGKDGKLYIRQEARGEYSLLSEHHVDKIDTN